MDDFQNNYISIVTNIMPIFRDKHKSFCPEMGTNKTNDKEINFGEVLDKVTNNVKNKTRK